LLERRVRGGGELHRNRDIVKYKDVMGEKKDGV
jgi:hypothetical protein